MKHINILQRMTMLLPELDSRPVMLFKDAIRPALSLIASFRIPYKVIIEQPCRALDGPVIYAVNHFCFADTPIMGCIAPKRSYILLGKQRLGISDRLYFHLNGVIFVDRRDKEDRAASKRTMIAYLKKGRSIVMFPEGTWNLTENQLILPLKWGIIDVARAVGAKIVPVALDYDRKAKECLIRFGEPVDISADGDKLEAVHALRDTMASMRWAFLERKGVFRRSEMDMAAERRALRRSIEEYPPIDWAYECSCIYQPYDEVISF